jgi:hypothetical protein
MLDFFVDEFSGCGGGGFPFLQILFGPIDNLFFRHKQVSSLAYLDAGKRKEATKGKSRGM